jgi:hypothetical protein
MQAQIRALSDADLMSEAGLAADMVRETDTAESHELLSELLAEISRREAAMEAA